MNRNELQSDTFARVTNRLSWRNVRKGIQFGRIRAIPKSVLERIQKRFISSQVRN